VEANGNRGRTQSLLCLPRPGAAPTFAFVAPLLPPVPIATRMIVRVPTAAPHRHACGAPASAARAPEAGHARRGTGRLRRLREPAPVALRAQVTALLRAARAARSERR